MLLDNTSSLKASVPRWKVHIKATNPRAVTFKLNISHPLKGSGSLNPFSSLPWWLRLFPSDSFRGSRLASPLISLHLFSELSPATLSPDPGTRILYPLRGCQPFWGFIKLKVCYESVEMDTRRCQMPKLFPRLPPSGTKLSRIDSMGRKVEKRADNFGKFISLTGPSLGAAYGSYRWRTGNRREFLPLGQAGIFARKVE